VDGAPVDGHGKTLETRFVTAGRPTDGAGRGIERLDGAALVGVDGLVDDPVDDRRCRLIDLRPVRVPPQLLSGPGIQRVERTGPRASARRSAFGTRHVDNTAVDGQERAAAPSFGVRDVAERGVPPFVTGRGVEGVEIAGAIVAGNVDGVPG